MHQNSDSSTPAPLVRLVAALMIVVLTAGCQSGITLSSVVPATTTLIPQLASTPISLVATPDAAVSDSARTLRGYVAADNTGAMFVAWTETGDSLSGTMQTAFPDAKSQSGIRSNSASFTGVRSGNHLSITVPQGFGTASTFSGELNDPLLILFFPDSRGTITPIALHPGTVAEYNQAVIALQQQVQKQVSQAQSVQATIATQAQVVQATATTQALQRKATTVTQATIAQATANTLDRQQVNVERANRDLSAALITLKSDTISLAQLNSNFGNDLKNYANDWSTAQRDYAQMQKDAAVKPFDCYQLSSVQYDVNNSIQYDVKNSIGYDHNSLADENKRFADVVTGVKQDIQAVQNSYSTLQAASAANTTGTPAPQFTQDDVTKAVNAVQQQIDAATAAMQGTQTQGADYDQKAAQLLKDTQTFVAGLKCS